MNTEQRWVRIDRLLDLAIDEDIGSGDVTTSILVRDETVFDGYFVSRQSGVVAGMEVVERFYGKLGQGVEIERIAREGSRVSPMGKIARITGPARIVLAGERIALNLLQRMSGVATLTRKYVDAVSGTNAKIYDTRKTMPGMRALDKLAVYIGGGENHRYGLYDMVLIKDNHLQLCWPKCPKGSVACAISQAKEKSELPVMIEVDTLDQLDEALEMEPDMVLLDNMDVETIATAVGRVRAVAIDKNLRRPLLEASGGVSLASVREIAKVGVDRISIGALTHSAVALDIGLDMGKG